MSRLILRKQKNIVYRSSYFSSQQTPPTTSTAPSLVFFPSWDWEERLFKLHIRKDVKEVIWYWNRKPNVCFCKIPKDKLTKTFMLTVRHVGEVIDGKFMSTWRSFTVREIKHAIDVFNQWLDPLHTHLSEDVVRFLKKLSLDYWIWNPFSNGVRSWFMKVIEEDISVEIETDRKVVFNNINKEIEQIAEWLMDSYQSKVLRLKRQFTNRERNCFIKGAKYLVRSIRELEKNLSIWVSPREYCEIVMDALGQQFGWKNVCIGNIASKWTYEELLPKCLNRLGLTED